MAFEFLTPVTTEFLASVQTLSAGSIGTLINIHTEVDGLPELTKVKLVLIGILENRLNLNAKEKITSLDGIRGQLYKLHPGNWDHSVADLGNIQAGETVQDTYYLVQKITEKLLKLKIIPIYIGGSQDLMYPIYRAFDQIESMINVVNVDSKFDLGDIDASITSHSFVGKMVVEKPYNLFNYSNLAYQTYFNSQNEIELLDRMYFEAIRLGKLDDDITLAEPILRDADVVGIDFTSIKAGDLAFAKANPNGLTGRQVCTLSRYSGISDRVKVFGIFELEQHDLQAYNQLAAETIWYFIEGYNYRSFEYPVNLANDFSKYSVPIDEQTLIFYKSGTTGRWWIELPHFNHINNKLKQKTLIPCSEHEYKSACNQKIPDRWLKARQKNEG